MANRKKIIEFFLNDEEAQVLMEKTKGQGGYQSLKQRLQKQYNPSTKRLVLNDSDIGQIVRYVNYSQGGYQNKLRDIFRRNIGMIFVHWFNG